MIIGFCQKLNARFLPFVVRLLKCKQVQKLFLRNLSLLSSQVEGSSEHISHQSPYLPINTKNSREKVLTNYTDIFLYVIQKSNPQRAHTCCVTL